MRAEFLRRRQEFDDVWSFCFSRPAGFVFSAGDYTELSLEQVDGNPRRWFSISSAPTEKDLCFTTWVAPQSSSFKQRLLHLKLGDAASFSPPMGNFNAPAKPDKLLFIAGGIGITPFRSLLVDQSTRRVGHDLAIIYTARPNQHLFLPEIKRSDAVFTKHISSSKRLSLADIKYYVPDLSDRLIYLAGPEPMMTQFFDALIASGHPRWRLRLSYFTGYQDI